MGQPPGLGQLPATASWPNYDKRSQIAPKLAATNSAPASVAPAAVPAAWHVQRDAFVGTPRLLAAKRGFLAPASGAKAALGAQRPDSREIIGSFLNQQRALVGHGREVLTNAVLKRDTISPSGLHTLVWEQRIHGLPVFGGTLAGHVTPKGDLVNLSSQFVPQPSAIAPPVAKRISPATALILAAQDVGENSVSASEVAPGKTPAPGVEGEFFTCPTVRGEARVRPVWLPLNARNLQLCYEVIFAGKTSRKMFLTLVDAVTGATWVRQNLTSSLTEATYNVYTTRSPQPMSPGYSEPNSAQPPEVPRQLVTLAALSTNASPQGWLPDLATNTAGNNVDAHLDRNNDDVPDLPRLSSTNRVFDFPLSLADSPLDHGEATTVNVFYWCNWIHDRLYDLGFTESAGNFQADNFGRGGWAHDPVMADVQDGANDLAGNSNNSNFTTPTDGMSPIMQLYLFTAPTPYRDGGLDAEDIIHEYCHGLTMRLVGGGQGISALQTGGMGEGWSDFYALSLLSQPGDDIDACYPFAAYITYHFYGELENYYFGIRRYPYSTDLSKSPLTFRDIDPSKAKSHNTVPRNSAASLSPLADEVHNMGEVWCSMLWEMRANFIRKLGFSTGNQLALQIVTDSLKLCPADPTFLESRDAILRAELVNSAGTNQLEVWSAFAKRGLGAQAQCPASSTATGVVEDFSLPDDLQVTPRSTVYVTGPVGGPFALSTNAFALYNLGTNTIPWTADAGAFISLSTNAGRLPPGAGNTLVKLAANSLAVGAAAGIYTNTVVFKNNLNGVTQPQRVVFKIGSLDQLTEIFDAFDFDLAYSSLTFTPAGDNQYETCLEPASAFHVDPAGATVLAMGDDTYSPITLTNGASVAVYKVRTNLVYIVSNGHISLQLGENHYFWSDLDNYFGQARVSALYADFNPEDGGTISYQQLDDRLVATWQNVPEWGDPRKNNFQIEMFFDGRIRITWLNIATLSAKVGLSAGTGNSPNFVETDLSASAACAPALALTLPATAAEGDGLLTAAATLALPVALETDLLVTLESSDTTKLQVPATLTIPAGQTAVHFDLQIIDNPYVDGTLTVRVMAAAAGFRPARAFIKVADNDVATLVSQFDAQGKTISIATPNLLYGYVVESAPSLQSTNWTTETNYLIAPDGQRKLLITPAAPHRFYRGHKVAVP